MAAENFKVKKGLEVGTAITATSSGVNVTGIVTATQFVGDGSGLTGVTGSGSGVVVKDEGSAVGTAGTINFVGSGVAATLSQGTATVTVNAGGLDNVVEDLTPQLGGNLDLNGKFVNGTGGANITGVVTATTLKGNGDFVDIDVDGTAELDNVNIAGVTTMTGNLTLSSPFPKIIITDTNNDSDYEIANANGLFRFKDITNSTDRLTIASNGTVNVNNDLNVGGRADLDDVVVAGVSTFSSNIDANGNIDVSGRTDLDDLVVSGVGTFSTRIDTNGVSFGTNNNTFAAKFVDNAVANFGTHNDLKISHDNSNALIRNSTGKMIVVGVVSATSGAVVTGVVTATTFSGSGASLTNLPSAQLTGALPALDGSALTGVTGSGSGIIVRHDGSVVGTASSINFSTNLDVSAISAGIVTVTASGGSSQNVFSTIAVSGQSNVVADSTTDTLTFAAGSNVTLTTNAGTDTVTIAAANDNTQLSSEQVQDIVGAMFSGNTETDITATYQDADGTIDLVVDLSSLNADNLGSGTIPNGRFPATLPATSGANLTALNASEITSGTLPIARITDGAVTFAKMQDVGTGVFIGRDSSGTGDIETLTAAEARTLLNVADGATAGITTASTNITATWDVIHNSASAYRFTGPGQDGAENNPDIYLVRGHKYRFSLSSTSGSHPLQIRDTGGTTYTDGVTYSDTGNNRTTAGNDLDISVQHDAPAALKYHCTAHGAMVGNIYIVGQHLANGANNRIVTATSAYGLNGESGLTYNGSALDVTGSITADDLRTDNSQTFYLTSANDFRFRHTGGSERLRITSTGQVAIGTVTAETNFLTTINGDLSLGEKNGTDNTYLEQKQNGDLHIINSGRGADGAAVNITGGAGGIGINRYNTIAGDTTYFRDFTVYNGKSTKVLMVDGSSSKVGIGTDNPTYKLHVDSGDAAIGLWKSRRSSGSYIDYSVGANGAALGFIGAGGQIISSAGADSGDFAIRSQGDLLFSSGGSVERLRITEDGEVGINKSSPNAGVKLHVGGTARFDDDVSIASTKKLFTNSSQGQLTIQGGATYPGSAIKFAGGQSGTTDQGQMIFYAGTATSLEEKLRITSAGRFQYYSSDGSFSSFRETFRSGNISDGGTFTAQTHNCHACGTVTITANLQGSSNNKRCRQYPISLNSTSNANIGSALFTIDGSSGQDFSVAGTSRGVTVTNSSGNTVFFSITFDITGSC